MIAKTEKKVFSNVKNFFTNFFAVDIENEDNVFDKYINKDIQTESDRENAQIAQILKDSLENISKIPEEPKQKKNSKLSVKKSVNTDIDIKLESSKEIKKDDNNREISK